MIRFPFLCITSEGFAILIVFQAPLLRPCKIVTQYLSKWPLLFSVLQSQLGLSSRVANSAHRCGYAVPSGAISLNHFLASVRILCLKKKKKKRILCLSSVLRRETSSWIMSSYAGRWVRKIVCISLIVACASPEYSGACLCQFNISAEENGW